MGVSLDGVMAPRKDGERPGKRQPATAQGTSPSGPAGWQEVGCGTLSSEDRAGERLVTRRMARMPESHKATLKSPLTAEVRSALRERPDLQGVTLAAGAADNWSSLRDPLPFGDEGLDFSHASAPLREALAAASGQATARYRARFDT